MSRTELRRVAVMARVQSGELKVGDAAELMAVTYRQAKRIWKRYREEGAEGLKHGGAGQPSNRGYARKLRAKVLRLVRQKYSGDEETRFGPTLAAEHLASEDGISIDAETLRRWMLAEGLWSRVRKRKAHRKRRARKEHFGELVQLDGSFHDWLEGRGPKGCLMDMVDDATSMVMAQLGEQETTWAAANILRAWIESYGVPLALYTDWKNVYVREPTEKEMLRGEAPLTQFGRMCQKLGIRIIAAASPEAKGRVERYNGVHQDRLIKKMRRKKIATLAAANEFLAGEYLGDHNERFAKEPAKAEDYHGKRPSQKELREVFRLEEERTISNDWVVRYENRYFQLKRQNQNYAPAKAKVLVCQWQDGTLEIHYRGKKLEYDELPGAPLAPKTAAKPQADGIVRRAHQRPSDDHPWHQDYRSMKARPQRPPEAAIFRTGASASP